MTLRILERVRPTSALFSFPRQKEEPIWLKQKCATKRLPLHFGWISDSVQLAGTTKTTLFLESLRKRVHCQRFTDGNIHDMFSLLSYKEVFGILSARSILLPQLCNQKLMISLISEEELFHLKIWTIHLPDEYKKRSVCLFKQNRSLKGPDSVFFFATQ